MKLISVVTLLCCVAVTPVGLGTAVVGSDGDGDGDGDGGGVIGGGGGSSSYSSGIPTEGRGGHLRWEMPRPCPVCSRVYSNNSNLRRHMKSAHVCRKNDRSLPGNSRYKYSFVFPTSHSSYRSPQQQQSQVSPVLWKKTEPS